MLAAADASLSSNAVHVIRRFMLGVSLIASGSGCTNAHAPTNPDSELEPPAGAELLQDSSYFSREDIAWAKLALQVPGGFAGVYINEDRKLVLLLTQPEKKMAAIAALSEQQFAALPPGSGLSEAIVQKAKWNFAQLYDWARFIVPRAEIPVIMVDIDEVHNRISLGVLQHDVGNLEANLEKLSVPPGLVSVQAQTPVCMSDMVPAVRVWAKDSITGQSVTPGARLTIRSTGFTETMLGTPNFPQAPLEAGVGKTGVFDVSVQQNGYKDWEQKNVTVRFNGCAPVTAELTAVLRPR